jgi:hypothetical protein
MLPFIGQKPAERAISLAEVVVIFTIFQPFDPVDVAAAFTALRFTFLVLVSR